MKLNDIEQYVLREMTERRTDLLICQNDLLSLHALLIECFERDGTLYLCGNGGSFADCVHIVGELCKSFERKRPVPNALADKLRTLPFGEALASHLECGFRAHALGCNGALRTAIENDCTERDIAFAQELNALACSGDVLMALSTSGNARNCRMAMSVARAKACTAVALTGPTGGEMYLESDLCVRAPGDTTKTIQESHQVLWHTLCLLIEAHYFPELR